MSNENARKLLRQSADALSICGRDLNQDGELMRALVLAVQALTEAALDEPVTVPDWVNEDRLPGEGQWVRIGSYEGKPVWGPADADAEIRRRIGAVLDEPPAIPEDALPWRDAGGVY